MRVYVIRHGESESNASKKWTGWMDVELTEKGKKDAEKAREVLKNIKFDKVYSSDLKRALDTMKIVLPEAIFEASPLLREINVGSLENKPINILTEEGQRIFSEMDYTGFGGESKEELRKRIRKFINSLDNEEYENVAVFSHGGWLYCLLELVLETEIPRKNLCCNNCTVAIFEFASKRRLHSWINNI